MSTSNSSLVGSSVTIVGSHWYSDHLTSYLIGQQGIVTADGGRGWFHVTLNSPIKVPYQTALRVHFLIPKEHLQVNS